MEIFIDLLKAFAAGGFLCVIGQILIDKTSFTPGRILVGYVIAGVILTAVGFYPKFAEWAGAGASVPLAGFGNLMAKGTVKAIEQEGAKGILTGALTAASGGLSVAMLCGVIASLISKPKEK